MQITKTEVELTSLDLMSIIEEYGEIPNLNITGIHIDNSIKLDGSYKAGGTLHFSITLSLFSYNKEKVTMRLEKVKVWKLGVFNWIKKYALNKLIKNLNINGVKSKEDFVAIDINKIMDILPFYLKLDLRTLEIREAKVLAVVENVKFSLKKSEDKSKKSYNNGFDCDENINTSSVHKTEDEYTKVRKKIENKVPDKYDKLLEYAFILPDIIALFYRLFKDKRVSIKTKLVVGSVIGYLASPIDIIPDFMPFIGKIDDLAIAFYALNKVINDIPVNIIMENWQGDFKTIKKIQEGVKYINKASGGGNVDKLLQFAEKVYEFSKEDKIDDI